MRERVRAIIKASRKAIMEEEGPLYDDTWQRMKDLEN